MPEETIEQQVERCVPAHDAQIRAERDSVWMERLGYDMSVGYTKLETDEDWKASIEDSPKANSIRAEATEAEHKNHMKFDAELYTYLVDPVECCFKNEAEQHQQMLEAAKWSRQRIYDLENQLNKADGDGAPMKPLSREISRQDKGINLFLTMNQALLLHRLVDTSHANYYKQDVHSAADNEMHDTLDEILAKLEKRIK